MGTYDPSDLLNLLKEIEDVLSVSNYTDVIRASDLNWDILGTSQFSIIIKNFISKNIVESIWKHHKIDFSHLHTEINQSLQ